MNLHFLYPRLHPRLHPRLLIRLLIILGALLLPCMPSVAQAQSFFPVVMLGDSITAGYGLSNSKALPSVLQQELKKQDCNLAVDNKGISGDTTFGGASRLMPILRQQPKTVIVALGANDALRGFEPHASQQALAAIITALIKKNIQPILVGMKAPRSWGKDYTEKFDNIFPTLAQRFNIPLYPFLLEGVALNPALNQRDGIHPNEQGVLLIARNLASFLKPHLSC